MADQQLKDLTATTTPADTDILYTVVDPAGTPLDRKITWTTIKTFFSSFFTKRLTTTVVKTSAYNAQPDELIPCDISGGSFAITLPSAPTDKTKITVKLNTLGAGNELSIVCGGTDKFNEPTGNTTIYLYLFGSYADMQYNSSTGIWHTFISAGTYNWSNNNPAIDATTPISNTDITVDPETKVLTLIPPKGYFNIFIDGGGIITRFRKVGTINFPAFTDTSGIWYFYFDSTGTPVTTQTSWNNFRTQVPLYRVLWNKNLFKFTVTSATATLGDTYTNNSSTFTVKETISGGTTLICERTTGTNDPLASGNLVRATGAGTDPIVFSAWDSSSKMVAQYVEYHINDIPASTHLALHLDGARWAGGLNISTNALSTGTPNTDGRNTVIALSTGTVLDDNLPYTITNDSTPTDAWQQNLGEITPASLNATNSGLFKVFTQNANGDVIFLPATRFPFAWNVATNRPETISSSGVRTLVTDNRWFVYFAYSTQNPVAGEPIKIVSAPSEFTSLANAQAYTWASIQALYPTIFGNDFEIRPLYRIIFYNDNSGAGAFPAGCKYSVIRETQDIRKGSVTSTSVATGSIPASSVTVVASGSLGTNVQTSLEILDAGKAPLQPVTTKTTLVDADEVTGNDSENTFGQIRTTWTNVKAFLANYFATLGTIQTFTNVKKFTKDTLAVLGTGEGFNNITTANTSGTSYNNIIPAKDGTFAMTSDIVGGSSLWTALAGATRVSNTSFTVTGDQTAIIKKGMIIKWTESSTVRVAMVSIPSTVSTDTTVTIVGDTMASIDSSSLKYCMLGVEMFQKNFTIAGAIGATGTDVANVYYATEPMRVIGADLQVGTAGTTNSTTIDINKGGTTMFTTKPTLATTVATSPTPFTADSATSLALADKVTLDIDAIQTTSAIDLYVQLYVFPTRYLYLT